ncbi:hypothetical protein ACFOD9_01015 [Novosphingobium bradum]|uniref:Polyketide cyclase n=1 Tax=Novosphingobium bradum TaxID=1737444 RepID=A0ABV7IKS3_9SPHN
MLKPLTTMLIGSVQYTISDTEKDVVDAIYVSQGSMAAKPGKICRGRAVGDTSNGFAGSYVIQYFDAFDELAGTYNWHIEAVGDAYRLTWRTHPDDSRLSSTPDELLYEGIGFPNSDRSICVAYWFTQGLSERMMARMAAQG